MRVVYQFNLTALTWRNSQNQQQATRAVIFRDIDDPRNQSNGRRSTGTRSFLKVVAACGVLHGYTRASFANYHVQHKNCTGTETFTRVRSRPIPVNNRRLRSASGWPVSSFCLRGVVSDDISNFGSVRRSDVSNRTYSKTWSIDVHVILLNRFGELYSGKLSKVF